YAANQLFATLDPTLRRITLPDIGPVVLADTVGFIRHLPHKLVEAFRATLEETENADLLLHVVDSHSSERDDNMRQGENVLIETGADDIPMLVVYNKIDLLEGRGPGIVRDDHGRPLAGWPSAQTAEGIPMLFAAVSHLLDRNMVHQPGQLAPNLGGLRAVLHQTGSVVDEG